MKIISYDVEIKSTKINRSFATPKVYTNDLNSVVFQFNVLDMKAEELTGATATTLLYMNDGSFFQNSTTDVDLVGNVFSYTLKESEGNHGGLAQIQLVVKIGTKEYATQLYNFEVVKGLETKVAQEVMIHDWTTLTREARDFLDQAEFDESARVLAEQNRASAETTRSSAETTRQSNENTRQSNEVARVTAEVNRKTVIDAKADKLQAKNLVVNGDFSDGTTGWIIGSEITDAVASNNTITFTGKGDGVVNTTKWVNQNTPIVSGDKIYRSFKAKRINDVSPNNIFVSHGYFDKKTHIVTTNEAFYSDIVTSSQTKGMSLSATNELMVTVKNVAQINLTTIFGVGNEPTKFEMDQIMARVGHFSDTKEIATVKSLQTEKANKKQEDWITPTLLNGATGTVQYRKNEFGLIEFKGKLNVTATFLTAFNLSKGYQLGYDGTIPVKAASVPAVGYIRFISNLCYLQSGPVSDIDFSGVSYVAGA